MQHIFPIQVHSSLCSKWQLQIGHSPGCFVLGPLVGNIWNQAFVRNGAVSRQTRRCSGVRVVHGPGHRMLVQFGCQWEGQSGWAGWKARAAVCPTPFMRERACHWSPGRHSPCCPSVLLFIYLFCGFEKPTHGWTKAHQPYCLTSDRTVSLPLAPRSELLHWGELCIGQLVIKDPLSPVFLMRVSSSGTHRRKECFAEHSSGTSKSYCKIIANALTTFFAVFYFFIFCFHSRFPFFFP